MLIAEESSADVIFFPPDPQVQGVIRLRASLSPSWNNHVEGSVNVRLCDRSDILQWAVRPQGVLTKDGIIPPRLSARPSSKSVTAEGSTRRVRSRSRGGARAHRKNGDFWGGGFEPTDMLRRSCAVLDGRARDHHRLGYGADALATASAESTAPTEGRSSLVVHRGTADRGSDVHRVRGQDRPRPRGRRVRRVRLRRARRVLSPTSRGGDSPCGVRPSVPVTASHPSGAGRAVAGRGDAVRGRSGQRRWPRPLISSPSSACRRGGGRASSGSPRSR
jgi:hypothetical protein